MKILHEAKGNLLASAKYLLTSSAQSHKNIKNASVCVCVFEREREKMNEREKDLDKKRFPSNYINCMKIN